MAYLPTPCVNDKKYLIATRVVHLYVCPKTAIYLSYFDPEDLVAEHTAAENDCQ